MENKAEKSSKNQRGVPLRVPPHSSHRGLPPPASFAESPAPTELESLDLDWYVGEAWYSDTTGELCLRVVRRWGDDVVARVPYGVVRRCAESCDAAETGRVVELAITAAIAEAEQREESDDGPPIGA